jgi:hypothetical protein
MLASDSRGAKAASFCLAVMRAFGQTIPEQLGHFARQLCAARSLEMRWLCRLGLHRWIGRPGPSAGTVVSNCTRCRAIKTIYKG